MKDYRKNKISTMKTKYRRYCKLFLEGKITISQYKEMCYISDIVQRKGWQFFTERTTNQCAKLYIEEHKRKVNKIYNE